MASGEVGWWRAIRPWLSALCVVAVATVAEWGLHRTGGSGALLAGAIALALSAAYSLRPPRIVRRRRAARRRQPVDSWMQHRRTAWSMTVSLVVAFALWNAVSMLLYVTQHNTADPLHQRMATWGRDHGYSPVIDWLEARTYDEPPSVEPADELALDDDLIGRVTTTSARPAEPVDSTSPPTSTTPVPQPPQPLATYFTPALAGEGQWTEIARAGGEPAVWATSIRPYPAAGGVVASMAVIDQTYLRASMFNGDEEPGGSWVRDDHVPTELYPSLVVAMNSGFRFEHINGGYMTEGQVLKPLLAGEATIAIAPDGKMVIGELGREIQDDGSWVSIRQNLKLMVDNGVSMVNTPSTSGVWWGADYGREVYVNRSAVCELADGRLAYLLVGKVDAAQMAESLVNVGCMKAVQLDINGTWPNFFTFVHNPDGSLLPVFLDRRMGSNTYRYLRQSAKEFFAFFDVTLVPTGSVLDA